MNSLGNKNIYILTVFILLLTIIILILNVYYFQIEYHNKNSGLSTDDAEKYSFYNFVFMILALVLFTIFIIMIIMPDNKKCELIQLNNEHNNKKAEVKFNKNIQNNQDNNTR